MAQGQGLDRNILIIGLKKANDKVKGITNADQAWETWVNSVADTIEEYVKSAKVITTGTSTNQTGTLS